MIARYAVGKLETGLGDVMARQVAAAVAVGDAPAVDLVAVKGPGCSVIAAIVKVQAFRVGCIVVIDRWAPLEDVIGKARFAEVVAVGAQAENDVAFVKRRRCCLDSYLLASRVSLLDWGLAIVHDGVAELATKRPWPIPRLWLLVEICLPTLGDGDERMAVGSRGENGNDEKGHCQLAHNSGMHFRCQ